ncbi:hypothetical protein V6N13_059355 [Hibiscus sabdariffa]
MTDALRVVEKMNGINLYGFKLSVALAKYKGKSKIGVREVQNGNYVERNTRVATENGTSTNRKLEKAKMYQHQDWEQEGGKSSNQREDVVKRVIGHVESEELWRMKRCLVGEMATVCSVKNIKSRLVEWGMGEIKVYRLGGKLFLLPVDNDELFMMLEDLQWSYRKEVFINVELWTEEWRCRERATWIEISGIPLHCWNHVTLKRVAELWGKLEALGENAGHVIDCEKVTMLINTSQIRRIDEMVELEVGKISYIIRVVEMGLSDNSKNLNVDVKLSRGGKGEMAMHF